MYVLSVAHTSDAIIDLQKYDSGHINYYVRDVTAPQPR